MEIRLVIIQLVTAALGSIGFSLLYRLKPENIPVVALGSVLTWGIYLLSFNLSDSIFFVSFTASVFCTFYAEVLSKLQKTPVTVVLVPSIIPMIPGGPLYYTMTAIVSRDFKDFENYGMATMQYALAIALGIAGVSALWAAIFQRKAYRKPTEKKETEN